MPNGLLDLETDLGQELLEIIDIPVAHKIKGTDQNPKIRL